MAFVNNILDGLSGLKNTAQGKWCKFKRGACFTGETPVYVYSVAAIPIMALPIKETSLLQYAVTNNEVNNGYGLIASADENICNKTYDPYTSKEQRERDKYKIDSVNWYEVVFDELLGNAKCKLALNKQWIDEKNYSTGTIVNLNLPEQGINGPFKIISIKHILPQKKPGKEEENKLKEGFTFSPITGIFIHESDKVLRIKFENGDTLRVTENHPIYSNTYKDWKLASEIEKGESLLSYNSDKVVVSSISKIADSLTVYNLEVKDYHNFLVGKNGIVAHNSYFPEDIWKVFNVSKSKWHKVKEDMITAYSGKDKKTGLQFINKNGEKWPHWLGENPDVGISDEGHLLFKSRTDNTKIWNTFEDASIWKEE